MVVQFQDRDDGYNDGIPYNEVFCTLKDYHEHLLDLRRLPVDKLPQIKIVEETEWHPEQIKALDAHRAALDFSNTYECADLFRFARQNIEMEVAIYEGRQAVGCCGFYDEVIDVPAEFGGPVLFGFNYGH